jgi:hypothetical protein
MEGVTNHDKSNLLVLENASSNDDEAAGSGMKESLLDSNLRPNKDQSLKTKSFPLRAVQRCLPERQLGSDTN